jgi:superfamily II DNA or RNA helicase
LFSYFGDKCIEYSLERAIREEKLTPYFYYPQIVFLTADELDKYHELSRRIIKHCHINEKGKTEISEAGKKLLIERARIVAGAANKVAMLKKLMQPHKDDTQILVYCGAARSNDFSQDSSEQDIEGERQIVSVSKMLGLELGMKVTHFTSAESSGERERIRQQFAKADPYQAIVAIKCLDEGVNIPSIKTAFILASSTNPKEYIQRRGRVLRKYPGKTHAVIYDFVTLPEDLSHVNLGSETARFDLSLVKKEILRMKEFGEISKNPSDADQVIKELSEVYGLDTISEEDYFDE